jgi:hypothetical protein
MSAFQIIIEGKPMSNYSGSAINPKTGEAEPALFMDCGTLGYYVRFEDGSSYHDSQVIEVKSNEDMKVQSQNQQPQQEVV